MRARRLFKILSFFIAAAFLIITCCAEGNAKLSQAYIREQNIDAFIAGDMNSDDLNCKVSNQPAEIAGSGLLAEMGIAVRTTILVDISSSIRADSHENIIEYLKGLVKNIGGTEQYKIVTFGDSVTVVQDFTANRNELNAAIEKIKFIDSTSMIYDTIYNNIPELKPIDGKPCYYRAIIISDGNDNSTTGRTREEAAARIGASKYPFDVVAVSRVRQEAPHRDLFALAENSGGRYFNLWANAGAEDIAALAAESAVGGIYWLRAKIPAALMDGSVREINIYDGTSSVQADMKIPVYTPPETIPPEEGEEGDDGGEGATSDIIEKLTTLFGEYTLYIYAGAGILLVLIIVIIIIGAAAQGKKKAGPNIGPASGGHYSENTLVLPKQTPGSTDEGDPYIQFRNIGNPNQVWEASLETDVYIGREISCRICIADSSVSRRQCKLYIINSVAIVENLSETNMTLLNGNTLSVPTAIKPGDKLKCGRATLIVEALNSAERQRETGGTVDLFDGAK